MTVAHTDDATCLSAERFFAASTAARDSLCQNDESDSSIGSCVTHVSPVDSQDGAEHLQASSCGNFWRPGSFGERHCVCGKYKVSESVLIHFRLFAFNRSVDDYNQKQLDALPSPPIEYLCTDSGDDDGARYQLIRSCQAPSRLVLKRGAQVMLVKNLLVGEGLVNGCRGVVTSFRSSGAERMKLPVVTFATPRGEVTQVIEMQEFTLEAGGRVVATRKQLPLKLVLLRREINSRPGEYRSINRRE